MVSSKLTSSCPVETFQRLFNSECLESYSAFVSQSFGRVVKAAFYCPEEHFGKKINSKKYELIFLEYERKISRRWSQKFLRGLSKLHSKCPDQQLGIFVLDNILSWYLFADFRQKFFICLENNFWRVFRTTFYVPREKVREIVILKFPSIYFELSA